MNKTTVYLPNDLRLSLKAAARRRGQAEADLVRAAIRQYLDQDPRTVLGSIGSGEDSELSARDSEAWLRQEWEPR